VDEGEVENDSVAIKLTANHPRSEVESGSEVVKLTMAHNQREVIAAASYDVLLQKDRRAKPFVVRKDKVKSFRGDPSPSWLEPVRGPSAPSPAATTEACADPTGLYDFMTQRQKPLPPVPTMDQPQAAVSDHTVVASATLSDLDLAHDVTTDIIAVSTTGTAPTPVKKWKRKPVRLKEYCSGLRAVPIRGTRIKGRRGQCSGF